MPVYYLGSTNFRLNFNKDKKKQPGLELQQIGSMFLDIGRLSSLVLSN